MTTNGGSIHFVGIDLSQVMETFANSFMPQRSLTSLTLKDCNIDSDSLRSLSSVLNASSLVFLDLSGNHISDPFAIILAHRLRDNTNLKTLLLRGRNTTMTWVGVHALSVSYPLVTSPP